MISTKIEVDNFQIRKLELTDANSIYEHVKDPEIVRYTLNIPHPYPKDGAKKFIEDSIEKWNEGTVYRFGIVIDNQVVGICDLKEDEDKVMVLGYWLGKKYWGQGIMSKAVKAVVKFGFKELKRHRIKVTHIEDNKSSQRVIEKAGFKLEGKEREFIFREGKWNNLMIYGLLEQEYKN